MPTENDYIALQNDYREMRKALEICKGALSAFESMYPDNRGIKLALERASRVLNEQHHRS